MSEPTEVITAEMLEPDYVKPTTPQQLDYTKCLCRENLPAQDPDWECPIWSSNPDGLGCPVHRPTKTYCRVHHNAFYGDCHPCQLASLLAEARPQIPLESTPLEENSAPGEAEILKAQKEVIEAAIADLK